MFISSNDFGTACDILQNRWHYVKQKGEWEDVRVRQSLETTYLEITRQTRPDRESISDNIKRDEFFEDDTEALDRTINLQDRTLINYHIIHSPTYQVPVLYLTFKAVQSGASGSRGLMPLDEALTLLVPPSHRDQIRSVGVTGALSMTEHPISGLPVYFVHPCRTAEAINGVLNELPVDPEMYLITWIGLVGSCVGLDVPIDLARQISSDRTAEGSS